MKKWKPRWEGVIEGWTKSYGKDQLWRVTPHHDLEDLVQYGFVIYLDCVRRYSDVEDVKHFMALYKRCFSNLIHDLSKTRSGEHNFKADNTERIVDLQEQTPKEIEEIDEQMFISEAPAYLKALAELVMEGDFDLLDPLEDLRSGWRENQHSRLRRLLGSLEEVENAKVWLCKQGILGVN